MNINIFFFTVKMTLTTCERTLATENAYFTDNIERQVLRHAFRKYTYKKKLFLEKRVTDRYPLK